MNHLGYKSRRELLGVHPDLIIVVTTAVVTLSKPHDFTVFDGLRTLAEQRENIRKGVSWTMNSLHLPQKDGYGHAADLVPIVDGRLSWDDPKDTGRQARIDKAFSAIAKAMKQAADLHNIELQYGFDLWGKDKPHWQLNPQYYG